MIPRPTIPDPFWHVHSYCFNAVFDSEETRWKAGKFRNLKADAPFYEASFNSRLADKLIQAGYGIRRTDRDFELSSVSRELIEKFSKRTRAINKLAKERHAVIDAKARALVINGMDYDKAFATVKAEIGSKNRENKRAAKLKGDALLANWRAQMTEAERESLHSRNVKGPSEGLLEISDAQEMTVSHMFERSSKARELHVAGILLRRGIGKVSVAAARLWAKTHTRFERNGADLTTAEALAEEREMVKTAKNGQGIYEPIGRNQSDNIITLNTSPGAKLSAEQSHAVNVILGSRDLVTTVHGPAGSGKTTLMREAVSAIEKLSGRQVVVLAPSASAVQVLKDEGFAKSNTFQRFKSNDLLKSVARGQFVWVDEAGFLSARHMRWLLDWSARNGSRLILSGDTKQHHSVDRGDALRVLEASGACTMAALKTIIRQKVEPLREAVQDLSAGRTAEGFDKLNLYGAIQEFTDKAERYDAIADLHLDARARGESSLIVAPTHEECRAIADAVRAKQKERGLIVGDDISTVRLAKVNLTESQRRDSINYEPGQVIQFDKRAKGFKVGEQWKVDPLSHRKRVTVSRNGVTKPLPLEAASTFNVYKPEQMPIAAGDTVRITKNGHGFRNNELCTVKAICGENVTFTDGRSLPSIRRKLHLDQGIAVTSHASQGKTVDSVIVSAPIASFSQTNAAQFYVSMSRARIGMALFTDSKAALREAVSKPSERVSAIELMSRAIKTVRLPFLAKTPGMEYAMREAMRQQQASMGMER